jgi:hypothetical protein
MSTDMNQQGYTTRVLDLLDPTRRCSYVKRHGQGAGYIADNESFVEAQEDASLDGFDVRLSSHLI